MEDAIGPNGLTVKAERADEVKQAERQEEQLKAMQMEDEEDPRPVLGMDGAGEIPPGKSTNVESQAEDAVDPQEEPNKLRDQRVDVDEDSHQKLMQSVFSVLGIISACSYSFCARRIDILCSYNFGAGENQFVNQFQFSTGRAFFLMIYSFRARYLFF